MLEGHILVGIRLAVVACCATLAVATFHCSYVCWCDSLRWQIGWLGFAFIAASLSSSSIVAFDITSASYFRPSFLGIVVDVATVLTVHSSLYLHSVPTFLTDYSHPLLCRVLPLLCNQIAAPTGCLSLCLSVPSFRSP